MQHTNEKFKCGETCWGILREILLFLLNRSIHLIHFTLNKPIYQNFHLFLMLKKYTILTSLLPDHIKVCAREATANIANVFLFAKVSRVVVLVMNREICC